VYWLKEQASNLHSPLHAWATYSYFSRSPKMALVAGLEPCVSGPKCKCYASVLPDTRSYRHVLTRPTRPPYLFLSPALPVGRFTRSTVFKPLHLLRGWLLKSLISAFQRCFRWDGGFP